MRINLLAGGLLLLVVAGGLVLSLRNRSSPPLPPAARARTALEEDHLSQARQYLEEDLPLWPLHAETRFLLARVCRRLDDLPAFEKHLHVAAVSGWSRDAIGLERQLARAQSGKSDQLASQLHPLIESFHADRRLILEALVRGWLTAKQYTKGLQMTRVWLASLPDDWLAHLYRGRLLQLAGQAGASEEYETVLKFQPEEARARQWLGELRKQP